MNKHFYERNDWLLNHETNKTFDEIQLMSDDEFRQWFIDLRKAVVYAWDVLGQPPRVGWNEDEIRKQFRDMHGFPVHEFAQVDELTGEKNVIRNTSVVGNAANQWFPTMMKTRINYTKNDDGLSIYDHFVRDDLLEKTLKYARRHYKRDSFYHYSNTIKVGEVVKIGTHRKKFKTGDEFVQWFEENNIREYGYDYWIESRDDDEEYTGYNEDLKNAKYLEISDLSLCNVHTIKNIQAKQSKYRIRLYTLGQKLFPLGLKAFRVSWCQYAVNFPPLTAKYLYEKYTQHITGQDKIIVYDPSSGWGGRILGAMSSRTVLPLHYVGTDPNTDHTIALADGSHGTKYSDLADFYNAAKNSGTLFKQSHTYEVFQLGSEVIKDDSSFQKYRGKVDMVFTSPPYFAKEKYSMDPEQSCIKFSQYEEWRDGFLKPTLETAVEWLRRDRYLLWNIADAKFGGDMLPLEEDSKEILLSLGMEYKGVVKMSLAQMPGGNRLDSETGLPKAKNFCKVNGMWLKYEPIFVFYKP
jgi:hypothetical protein